MPRASCATLNSLRGTHRRHLLHAITGTGRGGLVRASTHAVVSNGHNLSFNSVSSLWNEFDGTKVAETPARVNPYL